MKKSNLKLVFALSVLFAILAPFGGAKTVPPKAGKMAAAAASTDLARLQRRARQVTIVRDDWGIPHISGKTDADAVFGMIYAQAEDDFNRVELNYLDSLGRHAEADGESRIWQDLRQKLFIDPVELKALYGKSPVWLKELMNAWADGLNYYLATHPNVKPKAITHFEPWMALSFTEGSIGGDIESISLRELAAFYGDKSARPEPEEIGDGTEEFPGSNGIAIAPSKTSDGKALLLINPHTTFFFRAEQQATSEQGLNVYGALTWGQFFVYQGFNDRLGWMHTSSNVDVIDEFSEKIVRRGGKLFYRFGKELRPVTASTIVVPYKTANGTDRKTFTVFRTHHGPIVRVADGKWISVSLMNKPIEALSQSYLRTKARNYAEFRKVLELKANSSNNTVYADAEGNIAYFHPQYIPRRDERFDWTKPVDGSDPATDYKGLHSLDEDPNVKDPPNGWIQNTNNWPYSAAGEHSPKKEDFPKYMDKFGENVRGLHAMRVLANRDKPFTLNGLLATAFDPYLPVFAEIIPQLVQAYDALPANEPQRAKLKGPIDELRGWNYTWGERSVPTSLAVYYGQALAHDMQTRGRSVGFFFTSQLESVKQIGPAYLMAALSEAVEKLNQDFGTWRTPWGEINRFQRLTGDIDQPFSDDKPSISVPFTSGNWGSLASFGARTYPGTKRMYGTNGNSFVAVVEFGKDKVRARAVTAGGESGHSDSPHFNDQAERYASGDFREVYFYRPQLNGHTEKTYHPGE